VEKIFLTIINMSLTASFVIAAIALARLLLKKAPKVISYVLWAVVGFRLLFPFSIQGLFSLLPFKSAPIPQDIAMQAVPQIDTGIAVLDSAVNASLPVAAASSPAAAHVNPLQIWLTVGSYVWLLGVAVMLVYSVVSIFSLKRRLRNAPLIEGNLREVENLKTPFVIGVFRPKIYIPAFLSDEERRYTVLHERTHIRRGDHLVKMAAYLALCLHWFNPFAWAAFVLMSADMEMSCDERVIKELGGNIKNAYSLSLVRMAANRKILNGSPLAFSEGGIKERVKNVLNFKKHSRIAIIAAVILTASLTSGFAVDRVSADKPVVSAETLASETLAPEVTIAETKLQTVRSDTNAVNDLSYSLFMVSTKSGGRQKYHEVGNTANVPRILDTGGKDINGEDINSDILIYIIYSDETVSITTNDIVYVYFDNNIIKIGKDQDTIVDMRGNILTQGTGVCEITRTDSSVSGVNPPHYNQADDDALARTTYAVSGLDGILSLLPRISQPTIDELVKNAYETSGIKSLPDEVLSYISKDLLGYIATSEWDKTGMSNISNTIMIKMDEKSLGALAWKEFNKNGLVYFSNELISVLKCNNTPNSTIDDFAKAAYEKNGFKDFSDAFMSLISKDAIDALAKEDYDKNGFANFSLQLYNQISDNLKKELGIDPVYASTHFGRDFGGFMAYFGNFGGDEEIIDTIIKLKDGTEITILDTSGSLTVPDGGYVMGKANAFQTKTDSTVKYTNGIVVNAPNGIRVDCHGNDFTVKIIGGGASITKADGTNVSIPNGTVLNSKGTIN